MPADTLWQHGWYTLAHPMASPNFGLRPQSSEIDLVVIHSISLPPGEYGGPEVQALFTNTLDWDAHPYFAQIRGMEVSSHFFIRRNGDLIQFVSCAATIATMTPSGLSWKGWKARPLIRPSMKPSEK